MHVTVTASMEVLVQGSKISSLHKLTCNNPLLLRSMPSHLSQRHGALSCTPHTHTATIDHHLMQPYQLGFPRGIGTISPRGTISFFLPTRAVFLHAYTKHQ